jgi:hypothetical protein
MTTATDTALAQGTADAAAVAKGEAKCSIFKTQDDDGVCTTSYFRVAVAIAGVIGLLAVGYLLYTKYVTNAATDGGAEGGAAPGGGGGGTTASGF